MYSFNEIVGNEPVIKNLKSAIKTGRVSHAYIFSGIEGMGKMLLAKTFSKALQCEKGTEEACGQCSACRTADNGNNPDIYFVRPSKTKALGVDDIREQIVKRLETKQYKYRYKIFIVNDADKMSVQAQNALLKTLEEPPGYGVILLLAENTEAFLPTVISRCVQIKLRSIPANVIKEYLIDKYGLEDSRAAVLAEYAQGSIGNAVRLKDDELFQKMRSAVIEALKSIKGLDLASVMLFAKDFEEYKDMPQLFDVIYMWYRDILAYKKLRTGDFIIEADEFSFFQTEAKKETYDSIFYKLDAVNNAKAQLRQNTNFQLTVEVMLMNLKESYSK